MIGDLKEVRFDIWCQQCKHFNKLENEEPCYECLVEPANVDSTRPVNFEKEDKSHVKHKPD